MRRFTGFLPFAALLVFSAVPGWSRDLTRYAIVLTDPPAATLAARQDRVGMEAAVSRIRNNHTPLKAELQRRNIEITGESQTLLNAVFVALNPALNQDQAAAQISQLELIPGVSFVAKMPRYELQLDAAEKLIGVPAAWTALGGISNAGAGVKNRHYRHWNRQHSSRVSRRVPHAAPDISEVRRPCKLRVHQ